MSLLHTAALVGSLAASVSAHGYVQGIVAGGKWYQGYSPSFQYQDPPPTVIGWSDPEDLDNGFIAPDSYSDPDIICHKSATPAGTSAKVAAGSTVELQWTEWPESHHGPVMDYLAKCSGSCSDVDKTSLEFFKIDEGGLVDGSVAPGTWASDKLIANNNSWSVTIPQSIAPGNYVLRHEIIALHSAGEENGAQNYPQCINLEVSGSGTETPAGTPATEFYHADDPGILINIYTALSSYKIPGPTLIAGGGSGGQPAPSSGAPAPSSAASYGASSSSVAAGSSSAPASSAPASYGASGSSAGGASSSAAGSYSAPASSSGAQPGSSSYLPSSAAPSGSAPASYPAYSSSSVAAPGSSGSASYPAPSGSSAGAGSSSYIPSGSASYPAPSGSSAGAGSSSYYPSVSASSGLTTTCTKTITISGSASSSFAAPGSSSAPAGSGSSYIVPASTGAPSYSAPASSAAPGSSEAPYPCLSNIVSAIPTGYLSSVIPVLPTGSAAHPSASGSAYPSGGYVGDMPSQPLPEGFTFGDLLGWFKFMMKQVFRKGVHARDLHQVR